jgi:hypothetical protein
MTPFNVLVRQGKHNEKGVGRGGANSKYVAEFSSKLLFGLTVESRKTVSREYVHRYAVPVWVFHLEYAFIFSTNCVF